MEQSTSKPTIHPVKIVALAYGVMPELKDSRDLTITNARGVFSEPIAEYVLMMMLAIIRRLPQLLELLTIKGATVTIDAMGCQREIAATIIAKGADYVLALKGNQGTLREDVELLFVEQRARNFADIAVDRHETVEKSHGRIETRTTTVTDDIAWFEQSHRWPGLRSIVRVETVREIGAKIERETRFYITSRPPHAAALAEAIRSHWGIENGLHWVMDMVFRDDEFLSRRHAVLRWQGTGCSVEDLKSSNGTFVRLRGPTALEHGDVLRMGDQMFRIELGGP